MKKTFSILLLCCALSTYAQNRIGELFKTMPDSLMPLLTTNNRLDMIDFMDAGMKARIDNLLNGESEMTYLSADSLSIEMSNSLDISLFLVHSKETYDSCHQVICMEARYKLSTSAKTDISKQFFSVNWQPLNYKMSSMNRKRNSPVLEQDEEVFSKQSFSR
jgi:hypothetical protein